MSSTSATAPSSAYKVGFNPADAELAHPRHRRAFAAFSGYCVARRCADRFELRTRRLERDAGFSRAAATERMRTRARRPQR